MEVKTKGSHLITWMDALRRELLDLVIIDGHWEDHIAYKARFHASNSYNVGNFYNVGNEL